MTTGEAENAENVFRRIRTHAHQRLPNLDKWAGGYFPAIS